MARVREGSKKEVQGVLSGCVGGLRTPSCIPKWLCDAEVERHKREANGAFPCLECGVILEGVRRSSGYCDACRKQVNSRESELGL